MATVAQVWEIRGERKSRFGTRGHGLFDGWQLAFALDNSVIAVANRGELAFWDPQEGKLLEEQRVGPIGGAVSGLSFSADSRYVATATGCGGAYLLRYREKAE